MSILNKRKKYSLLFLYLLFLTHLRSSNCGLIGRISKRMRYLACKQSFLYFGKNVNIEKVVLFENGVNIEIGYNSGISVNFILPSFKVICKNVMMGTYADISLR